MARDYGPDELAELDGKLARGEVTPEVHEARRAALLAEIGRGKTIELSTGEKLVQVGIVVVVIVVAVVAIAAISSGGGFPPVVAFIVVILAIAASAILAKGYGRVRRDRL